METRKELVNNIIQTYSFDLDHVKTPYLSLDNLMIEEIIPSFFRILDDEKPIKLYLPLWDSWLSSIFYNYYLIDNPYSFGNLRYPRKILLTYLKLMQDPHYRPLDMDKMFSATPYAFSKIYFIPGTIIKSFEIVLEVEDNKYVLIEFLNIPSCYTGKM